MLQQFCRDHDSNLRTFSFVSSLDYQSGTLTTRPRGARGLLPIFTLFMFHVTIFPFYFESNYYWSHIGLMSMLGWLITWSVQWMNADSLSFLILEFSSLLTMLALFHWNLCFCSRECSAILDELFPHFLSSACVNLLLFVRVCTSLLCIVERIVQDQRGNRVEASRISLLCSENRFSRIDTLRQRAFSQRRDRPMTINHNFVINC